ncbi:MAG: hypothetical protein COT36_04835 [Parcubacteria group bacterium CG08_land_8_20_14_0_20_38_56]|nr:MAG: hypothetical protein COT36_04835 [Parcubacteria group bacterium CG08_land_8_20_14_0_20_38_56]
MRCSVGIFAHNEEKNIGKLLEAVLNQKLNQVSIDEIIVVASGCIDKTVPIAKEFAKKDSRIKVLVQEKREGKASAINLFLKSAKNDILVIESGDTIPEKDTLENLVKPFSDNGIGMSGARPMPVNDTRTFMGFVVNLLWGIHHQISLRNPKMGEMIAFRNIFQSIPKDTAVDEASIEVILKNKGYKLCYCPEAIVYNKGPENIKDFLKQRRRIYFGHLALRKENNYQVSTLNLRATFYLLFKSLRSVGAPTPYKFFFVPGAILLEMMARFLGWWDYKVNKHNHVIWKVAKSTKDLSRNT